MELQVFVLVRPHLPLIMGQVLVRPVATQSECIRKKRHNCRICASATVDRIITGINQQQIVLVATDNRGWFLREQGRWPGENADKGEQDAEQGEAWQDHETPPLKIPPKGWDFGHVCRKPLSDPQQAQAVHVRWLCQENRWSAFAGAESTADDLLYRDVSVGINSLFPM